MARVEQDSLESNNALQGTYSSGGLKTFRLARGILSGKAGTGNGKICQVQVAGKKGPYTVNRLVYYFATGGVNRPLQSATLRVALDSSQSDFGGFAGRFVVVPHAPADINAGINGADIDAIPNFNPKLPMHKLVTPYSNVLTLAESDTEAKFILTPSALEYLVENNKVSLMIVEYTHDYLNTIPIVTQKIVTAASGFTGDLELVFKPTPAQVKKFKRKTKTKGAKSRGFKTLDSGITTGGKTVGNGFEDI